MNVELTPNPFAEGCEYTQELDVFVDKQEDVLVVSGSGDVPVTAKVSYQNWRTRFVLRAAALSLQPVELENWKVCAVRLAKEAVTAQAAMERTHRWRNAFWEKSYVFVQGDAAVVPEYED